MTVFLRDYLEVLALAQSADPHRYPQDVQDTLEFVDLDILVYPFIFYVSDQLIFTDQIDNPKIQIIQDYLGLQQLNTRGTLRLHLFVNDTLSFGQFSRKVIPESIFQNLFFTQYIVVPTVQVLTFTQTAVGYKTHGVKDTLAFTQTCKPGHVAHLVLHDTISLVSNAIGLILDVNFIAITLQPFEFTDHITLRGTDSSIRLRNPEFGDIDKYEQSRIVHHSRGLDLLILRDSEWPETEVLSYNFKALRQGDVWNLMTFYEANLGQNVVLTDYHGNNWVGVLLAMRDVAQEGIQNFIAGFDFQGVPVPANIQTVNQALSLTTGGIP